MREILGYLQNYMNRPSELNEKGTAILEYSNGTYEVWSVSDEIYEDLNSYSDEDWEEKFPEDWWRYCDGCNLGEPDTRIRINGIKLTGWAGRDLDYLEEEIDWEIIYPSLTGYFWECIGTSQPNNICSLSVDLAKYNNMTMGELWEKCEPK